MNEYILFDEGLRDRFLAFLADRGVACSSRPDTIAGYVVALADEVSEDLEDEIEDVYDELMTEQQALVEAGDDEAGQVSAALMSVDVGLADGRSLTIHIPAQYARGLHEQFSIDEIRGLVSHIARSAIDPAEGPACCQA
jgi:hypothetical protein